MVLFEEARNIILSSVSTIGMEQIHLLDVAGRVLAEDIIAPWDMPLCDNSAMDGYAINSADCVTVPCKLRVNAVLTANAKADDVRMKHGCAVRIMTGAPTPRGCDAIIPVEETNKDDHVVTILEPIKKSVHIRYKGEDITRGAICARAGSLIRPPEVNLLASFGISLVPVYRQPLVAILTTGNELVDWARTAGTGEIINSNAISLAIAVREAGAVPLLIGIAKDTQKSHKEKLSEGLKADLLITVSAGEQGMVSEMLEELGAHQLFCETNTKPGGATAFALHGTTPVFSLPASPASAMIIFEEFVRPALLKMQGYRRILRPLFKATLREELQKQPGKVQIERINLEREDGRWYASSAGNQQTASLKTMVDADALAVLPAENTHFAAGDEVDVHFYGNRIDLV